MQNPGLAGRPACRDLVQSGEAEGWRVCHGHCAVDVEIRHAPVEFADGDGGFHADQGLADAGVQAKAERQVLVGVGAVDVETAGVGEDFGIQAAARQQQADQGAAREFLAAEFGILGCDPEGAGGGAAAAQAFLDRVAQQGRSEERTSELQSLV